MSDFRVTSFAGDVRGELALSHMPVRGQPPCEWLIHANDLRNIDAWGSVALRTSIEFYARYQSRQVTVSPPSDLQVWHLLYHLLCEDSPTHARLSEDSDAPPGPAPSTIILPSQRVRSLERADQITSGLMGVPPGPLAKSIRYLASQIPELVDNSLRHGVGSPVAPVVCLYFDREEEQVQLVLSDLGTKYEKAENADENLLSDVTARGDDGALFAAVDLAASRDIDASLTLASGNGRVYWRKGKWTTAQDIAVNGFVSAITVQLD